MDKPILPKGTLVRIKPIPGISIATFYEGKLGVVVGVPTVDVSEYEIYVNEKTLWLIRGELEPVN
jgi:hypothetical protein